MKKIINLFLGLSVATLSFTSCDLNMYPDSTVETNSPEAYTLEYCEGLRGYIYGDLKALLSGAYNMNTDLYTDIVSVSIGSGNAGMNLFNWQMYSTNTEADGYWSGYFATVAQINYSLQHMQKAIDEYKITEVEAVRSLMGELYFFRAFVLYRASLLFCEDYDPARAAEQMGLPYPTKWDPDAKLGRISMEEFYGKIKTDITEAELAVTREGAANSIWLTKDAITAFKAQLALHMHEYDKASQYAQSLYAAYPLIRKESAREDLEKMWYEDNSTETILQLDLTRATLGTVNSYLDYLSASWNAASGEYDCAPIYIPERWLVSLYTDEDARKGVYINEMNVTISGFEARGYLITKFMGNKTLQTTTTVLNYRNMPKMFRVAEMYLIDAEAQYRLNGGGLEPLNALRESRGLAAINESGDLLFSAIKDERAREMIAEGGRLYDLKRWGDGFTRSTQTSLASVIDQSGSYLQTMTKSPEDPRFIWPIPLGETSQNPVIAEQQNPGY